MQELFVISILESEAASQDYPIVSHHIQSFPDVS